MGSTSRDMNAICQRTSNMQNPSYTIEKLPNSRRLCVKVNYDNSRLIKLMGAFHYSDRAVFNGSYVEYHLSPEQAALFKTIADGGFEHSQASLLYHPKSQRHYSLSEAVDAINSGQIVVDSFLADLEGF